MSKVCEHCGRGYLRAMNRSHSNRATLKRQEVNLQSVKRDGHSHRWCTRCIKTETKAK
ncbi:MAG: L28 family ribosomal protein [Patescibacteria group bacterium]